jgi:hypothetical protein
VSQCVLSRSRSASRSLFLLFLSASACGAPDGERQASQSEALDDGAAPKTDIRIETNHCVRGDDDLVDCTCDADEVAVSGGAYSGSTGNRLNASQAGPSFGASWRVWRSSCVDGTGTRVACSQPFAVCAPNARVPSVRIETETCATGFDSQVDCTCASNEVAISGGAYSGTPSNMLNASQAGPTGGASPRVWRTSCVNPLGGRVPCKQPFAICVDATTTPRIATDRCVPGDSDLVDCSCAPTEVAIGGGAYSGAPGNMLNASQAGPSMGGSPQSWRMSCVDLTGQRVACASPFAVCVPGP